MKELGENLNIYNYKKEKNTKRPVYLTGLLGIILIISFVFTLKTYEPTKNIYVLGSVFVYPITFLIVAYISKYYGFKESRKSIITSSILYISFMVLMMICMIPHANNITASYNTVVQYIFTNNLINVSDNFTFFYPTLGQFFSIVVAFPLSHILYAVIYNAVSKYTIDYLAVGLSLFIAYIIDRIIYMPILFAEGLYTGANTFNYFISCLTSEFIVSILACVIILIIYVIITFIKKKIKK